MSGSPTLDGDDALLSREDLAWKKAKEYAAVRVEMLYPPDDPRRESEQRAIAHKHFRELMYP
jgi:hypothetical protein